MTLEKSVNYVMEYNGLGQPTGTVWVDGKKWTFTASSAPVECQIPPFGKSTDKTTIAYTAFISYAVDDGSVTACTIQHPSGKICASYSSTGH